MKYFISIFVTAVLVFLGATIYYKGLPTFPAYNRTATSTQSGVPVKSEESLASPQGTASALPTPDAKSELITAIKAALVVKHGPDAESLEITVSKIEGNYASGEASAQGGGGMWYAAKVNGNWELVWDGNGQINCSDLTSYPAFPKDMIPECWDISTQKVVNR